VQNVYRDQGVSIHDKHIELIVRQMTRRVQIVDDGDSPWLPGAMVDVKLFNDTNDRLEAEGRRRRRPCSADGHHQGLARDRLVALGRVVPGDDPRAHRGRDRGQARPPGGPEGEHHHRQVDPGRFRSRVLQQEGTSPRHARRRTAARWAQVSDDDLDLASLLGEIAGDDSFSADLSAFQNIGTATYDESRCRKRRRQPEDEIGNQAI